MKKLLLLVFIFNLSACKDSNNKASDIQDSIVQVTNSLPESMARGGEIYTDYCMQCHLGNGLGVPKNFPPLANSNWISEKRNESIHAVKYGQNGEIVVNDITYDGVMVPMGLNDQQVADVLNYVMNNWGNIQNKMVTAEEVNLVAK